MEQGAFPRYEKYQSSGVQWLGDIPHHWELKKNKFLFTEQKATVGKKSADFTLLSLTLKGVIARDMENPQGKFPAEFNTYKIVKPDDLIFCLFDIEETPRTIGRATQAGMITGAYDVMECHPDVSAHYLSYYYLSLDNNKRLKPLYTGLRKVIQRDTFMGIKTPVPPRVEQDRIANFLDQKTAEIDEAIAKKQRLIELLKEQKAILINQAVTKGLNPDVPMRDSGVEWIGEVPEHWDVKKGAHLFRIYSGLAPDGLGLGNHGESLYIKVSDLNNGPSGSYIDDSVDRVKCKATSLLPKGTIIFPKRGGAIFTNKVRLLAVDALVDTNIMGLEAGKSIDERYLSTLIKLKTLENVADTSTLPQINNKHIAPMRFPVPSIGEQKFIMEHVDRLEERFQSVSDAEQYAIDLLAEMKVVTIAEAVTGKIKL